MDLCYTFVGTSYILVVFIGVDKLEVLPTELVVLHCVLLCSAPENSETLGLNNSNPVSSSLDSWY